MAALNTILRLQWIHRRIKNNQRVTARDIADEFGGSVRTAQRSIEYLRDQMCAPIEYDVRRKTYFYTDPSFEIPTVSLSDGETIALLLVYEGMLQHLPLPLAQELSKAVSKLEEFLPRGTTSVNLSDLLERFSFALEPQTQGDDCAAKLDIARQALERHRTLRITYYTASRDEKLERDVDPYHITYRRGDWYVVGYCHLRTHVQTFAVNRMLAIAITNESFQVSPDFDANQYFEHAFGVDVAGKPEQVTLEFDLPEARYVGERSWHPSQQLERLPEGRLRMHLRVSITYELRQWVLSYGSRVRIIEPELLRDQVIAELQRACERYEAR